MFKKILIAVILSACALSPGCAASNSGANDIFCPVSVQDLSADSDIVDTAKRHDIDYRELILRCLGREREAMHLLFWVSTEAAGLDGAASQSHAIFVGLVLQGVGDAFFAECLACQGTEVQEAVRYDLLYAAGFDDGTEEKVLSELRRSYPRCFPETFNPL